MSKVYSKATSDRITYIKIYNALNRRNDIASVIGGFDCEQKCYIVRWTYRRIR